MILIFQFSRFLAEKNILRYLYPLRSIRRKRYRYGRNRSNSRFIMLYIFAALP